MSSSSKNSLEKSEQQLLLEVIWHDESSVLDQCGFDAQGINAYRRNLLANAQRALNISFPTVFKLLDSDISESIVYQFLRHSPPNQGDWTQWGDNFAHFLATTKVGENYQYLCECATLDWHVHRALHGRDQSFSQPSLHVLSKSEPEHIFIEFNQNVKVFTSEFPLTDIFQAHHNDDESRREIAMSNAKKSLLGKQVEQVVMVYRPEFQPQVAKLSASEGVFMLSLFSGKSLSDSLDVVKNNNDFSFEQWLITTIERNLIYYFKEK
jgi:hypothetical protein